MNRKASSRRSPRSSQSDPDTTVPQTEGVKYAGSKLKLLPQILQLVRKTGAESVLDGFTGTTRVAQALAKSGYTVAANDCSVWSGIFGTCYLLNKKDPEDYRDLIDHLNGAAPIDGWFTENYGGSPEGGSSVHKDGLKKPWQIKNTRKLDGIREEIDRLNLDPIEKAVALASLILALDKVDSTLGHFTSYLKEWSARSYHDLHLQIPALFQSEKTHQVFRGDIFDTLKKVKTDLAYFDPPYGSNNEKMPPSRVRYASYYHLWTSVCLNDKPELFGKSKRRSDTSDLVAGSVFEEFRQNPEGKFIAVEAIKDLLLNANAKYILLSYSSCGRATASELNEVINVCGHLLEVQKIDYKKNVMADMKWTNEWLRIAEEPNQEFLFLIEKE
ncbi:MAG: DNA adenine methylase [Planctomycetia bacterium]|nr:DNA adenine methylase [Planctomycetia bacterium]